MSDEDIELYNKPSDGIKRVIQNNDGYSDFYSEAYSNEESLKENAIDIYEGKDVSKFYWCLLTTFALNYNSKYAGYPFEGWQKYEDLMRDGDKSAVQNIQKFAAEGKNPLAILAKRANELGITTYASLRMNAFYNESANPWLNGTIYDKYKQYRYINENGSTGYYLSYAYPEVQEIIINILKEAASVEYVEGVNLDFCRYPYVVGYESIVSDAYKAQYGVDPKNETTNEGLNRWYQFRADIITEFMRKVNDQLGDKVISVRVPVNDCLKFGLDVEKWIKEGLIDELIVSNISHEEFFDEEPFVELVKGTNVKLYGGINTTLSGHDLTKEEEEALKRGEKIEVGHTKMTLQQFRLRALEFYNAGYDGVHIFNNWKATDINGKLGDKVELEKWYQFAYPAEWVKDLIVIKEPSLEYLSDIIIDGAQLSSFSPETEEYVVTMPYGTDKIPGIEVVPADKKAKVNVAYADKFDEETVITVTSSDGSKSKVYKILFKVASEPKDIIAIGAPVFTDFNGNAVTSLKANELVVVKVSAESKSTVDLQATLIVALYDKNNTLKDIAYVSKNLVPGEKIDFSAGITTPNNVEGYYIKVFVWDSISGQIPYSDVVTFPNK